MSDNEKLAGSVDYKLAGVGYPSKCTKGVGRMVEKWMFKLTIWRR